MAQAKKRVHGIVWKVLNLRSEDIRSVLDVPARGLEELFEMVRFERTDKAYDIWPDEKKQQSPEDANNPNIEARGYTE